MLDASTNPRFLALTRQWSSRRKVDAPDHVPPNPGDGLLAVAVHAWPGEMGYLGEHRAKRRGS